MVTLYFFYIKFYFFLLWNSLLRKLSILFLIYLILLSLKNSCEYFSFSMYMDIVEGEWSITLDTLLRLNEVI